MYDGTDDQSMLIGEVFGTANHKAVKSISSSGKFMFIDFRKQHNAVSYELAEFVAFIKYKKINSDCQSWLNNKVLMSPNNPNINCSWLITRQFGSYITLKFSYIEVKPMIIVAKMYVLILITILENSLKMDWIA